MRKIIASDYDGTLARPHLGVTDIDREAIRAWRAAGNLFGIVTGRGRMEEELARVDVEYDFTIVFNGTEIYDGQGALTLSRMGDGKVLYDALPIMLQKEGDWVDIVGKERSYYVTYQDKLVEERASWVKQEEIRNVPGFRQIYALRHNDAETLEIAAQLQEKFGDKMSPLVNGSWLNIAPPGVTKASGVLAYAKIMGVDEKNIFTIGDSYNDLDMVRRFGGFSVLNGAPELKAVASQVVDGIQELVRLKM